MSLTPLQLTSAGGLLQNEGINVNIEFVTTMNTYQALPAILPLVQSIILAAGGTGGISSSTLGRMKRIGAGSCPAFGDTIASSYPPSDLLTIPSDPPGFTGLLSNIGQLYVGNGDTSKFCQALSIAQSYRENVNQYIYAAVNANEYLADTFTNLNNLTTGEITSVNKATPEFGTDLTNLGQLINLSRLDEFGTPAGVIKQLAKIGGLIPEVIVTFNNVGISAEVIVGFKNPNLDVSVNDQKRLYQAMTEITGAPLLQILQIFGVKTSGINTLADLLDPVKIFPTSFRTLTVTNSNNESINIFINNNGTVNPVLAENLPAIAVSSIL